MTEAEHEANELRHETVALLRALQVEMARMRKDFSRLADGVDDLAATSTRTTT
jgi:hypothetical protein